MDSPQDINAPVAEPTEAAVAVAESASGLPSWMFIIVMGLAVMIAARPRKQPVGRLDG
ncbi:MAG: hypothetical protein AAFX52_07940 [Pseudomonadota bacterium]